MYKQLATAPGWTRVQWRREMRHTGRTRQLLAQCAEIPGVRSSEMHVELPSTTYMLPEVRALAETLQVTLPQLKHEIPLGVVLDLSPRSLRNYQEAGINFLLEHRRVLLCDAMGVGKSRQAAVAAKVARAVNGERPVVIVAPLFTREVWRRELLAAGAIARPEQLCCLVGRDLDHPSFDPAAPYYFVHYDVARYWWSMFQRVRPVAVILDEAHWVKNSRSARSIGANMVAGSCSYRFLLTGTPLENRPRDLWNLLTICTGAHTWGSPSVFRQRYCGATYNGHGYEDGEPTHTEELRARLAPFYLRREHGAQMPPLTRQMQVCEVNEGFKLEDRRVLGGRARQVLQAISRGGVQQVLPLLSRLRQVTSRAKLPATVEYVQNAAEQGEHVVVFAWERQSVHALAGRLLQVPTISVTGEMSIDERQHQVDRFQASTEPTVLLSTVGALKEGVTLHRARVVVLHDLDWVLTAMLQCEARVHRLGQQRGCLAVWMVAQGTSDQLIAPVLAKKAEEMVRLLGLRAGSEATAELLDAAGVARVESQVDASLAAWEAAAQ